MNTKIKIPCLEITQPIGTFYVGVMNSNDLYKIAYADIRRIEKRDIEKIVGIERPLSNSRVKEIKQYVTNKDATFPTGVILAIESKDAFYHKETSTMEIICNVKVAKIIDGQHRIAGFENYSGINPFFMIVTIFIDMDTENQAMVFGTINLAQTKVNRSLVYDLFELTRTRSPQKTCHNIAEFLNKKAGSPFLGRIKMLGIASEKNQTLTQAAVVESIIKYISGNSLSAMKDRDILLRGEKLTRADLKSEGKLIFRNWFIDGKDLEITQSIWNFFVAVRNKWPVAWERINSEGNILPRTNGYRALIRLFRPAFLSLHGLTQVPTIQSFQEILNAIHIADSEFTSDKYLPGASGESQLSRDLIKGAGLERKHF